MGLNLVYRKTKTSGITSYDAYDVATGTGLLNFYLGNNTFSSTQFYAAPVQSSASVSVPDTYPAYKVGITYQCDRTFQKQIILKGRAIFNVPIYLGGGTNASGYTTINLYSDGTLIQTGNSNVISAPSATYGQTTTIMDIPATTIKAGSVVRIEVILMCRRSQASSMNVMLGHDPMNMNDTSWTSTAVGTRALAQIPFKIDI
jgi:hypothetical protein